MNDMECLARWPGWAEKRPAEILASDAWAMRVRWGDEEATLRLGGNRPRDVVALRISFDDEEHFLGLGRREAYPDLAALWERKNDIPQALVLALVEKECGKLLQLLENAVRRQLKVIGLADADARDGTRGFEVRRKDGTMLADFALDVSPMVEEAFGDLSAIDTSHESIRSLTRAATVEYAAFALGAEAEGLASGDYLLAPELDNPVAARWCVDAPADDGKFHLRAAVPGTVTFAHFVDGAMPEVPVPDALELYAGSRRIAAGRYAKLAEQGAFAVEEVL